MSKPSPFEIIKSVLSAAIGVQSNENRERDFARGSIMHYIVAGALFTAAFVGLLVLLVSVIVG